MNKLPASEGGKPSRRAGWPRALQGENVAPMSGERYNAVIIGAGTAGLVTAAATAGLGGRVALIEREHMGGDCLNFGCVPSKALIASARAADRIRHADRWGLEAANLRSSSSG